MYQLLPSLRKLLLLGIICSFWHAGLCQDIASIGQLQNSPQQGKQKNKTSLKQVLQELQAWHHVSFVYNTEVVQDKFIAGDVKISGTLAEALRTLLNPLKLRFKKINDGLYVITSQDEQGISHIKRTPDENPEASAGKSMNMLLENLRLQNPHLIGRMAAITITGKVTDETNTGLPGVNVLLKGTNTGTTTNGEGNYSLSVPEAAANGTLIFSYIGYTSEEVPINGRTAINISLVPDIKSLSEVVVVGYGAQKRADLTGSVASVKGEEIKNLPVRSVGEALQGRAAGVYVASDNGRPGAGSQIVIRGPVNIRGASPLYVVDGIPFIGTGFNFNVQDIESIEVLKDATAAAIYGAQASAGVILITTRKGKAGALRVGLNANYGVRNAINLPQLLRRDEYIQAKTAFGYDAASLFGDPANYANLPDTDWYGELFGTGKEQNYTLSLTGGGEKSTFYMSGNYQRQDGIRIDNWIERYTFRLNTDHTLSKRLKVGQTLFGSFSKENPPNAPNQGILSFRSTPIMPVYDPTNLVGGWGKTPPGFNGANDVGLEYSRYERKENYEMNLGTYLDWQIVTGLTFRTNLATNLWGANNYRFDNLADFGATGVRNESFQKLLSKGQNFMGNATLTYGRTLGLHDFTAMAGYEARSNIYNEVGGDAFAPLVPLAQNFNLVQSDLNSRPFGRADRGAILSQFGRLNYAFANKYLLTFNVRRDGYSSRFSPDNRYGVFPSVSAGWKISEEAFFKGVPLITLLKLRGGYGSLGNPDVGGDFRYQTDYNIGFVGNLNGERRTGVAVSNKLPNADIRWETVLTTSLGLDAGLWNDRLTLSLDWYNRQTKDMLYEVPIAPSAGSGNTIPVNIGEMKNQGFEVAVNFQRKAGDFTYSAGVNGGFNANKLLSLDPSLDSRELRDGGLNEFYNQPASRTVAGQPLGQFWGLKADGIYATDAEAGETRPRLNNATGYVPRAGDLIYRDLDGDGIINNNDLTFIGNPWPKLTYGITLNGGWKGFDLQVFFNGVQGADIYNAGGSYQHTFFGDYNTTRDIFNASFFNGNGLTDVPRIGTITDRDPNGNWTRVSSYHVQNGSYLRLRNLQLGYTVPAAVLSRVRAASARIFLMTDNLFTITSYRGMNPDLGGIIQDNVSPVRTQGIDRGNNRYPISRLYSLGLNIEF
jgi:TonB-dependent starch-binding outer membrane protein SusC